jgi:hypothetical protein
MLDHAREAVAMATGKTRDDLDTDRKLNLALVRLLEIVGEAANRTPADERAKYREIPWAQIPTLVFESRLPSIFIFREFSIYFGNSTVAVPVTRRSPSSFSIQTSISAVRSAGFVFVRNPFSTSR